MSRTIMSYAKLGAVVFLLSVTTGFAQGNIGIFPEALNVQIQGESQGFPSGCQLSLVPPPCSITTNFLILVTDHLTGAAVSGLGPSNFNVTNHFSLLYCGGLYPHGTFVFGQYGIQLMNLGNGAYRMIVSAPNGCNIGSLNNGILPIFIPAGQLPMTLQVVVTSAQKRGQAVASGTSPGSLQ